MLLLLLFSALALGTPFLILLDYHKRHNLSVSVVYLVVFFASLLLLGFLVKQLGLALTYFVILVPVLLFGILILKNRK